MSWHQVDGVSRDLGLSMRRVEELKRRYGLLPEVERSRGSMDPTCANVSKFSIDTRERRVLLDLNFYPLEKGELAGAFSFQTAGSAYSGVPILPRETIPGTLLVVAVVSRGTTTTFPATMRLTDNPNIFPGSPPVPPYPDSASWNVVGVGRTDFSGMNIGGPCLGFNPEPYCTYGTLIGLAWRLVRHDEITTHPVGGSTELATGSTGVWLWNFPVRAEPASFDIMGSVHKNSNPANFAFNPLPNFVFGGIIVQQASSGSESATVTPTGGSYTVSSSQSNNDPDDFVTNGWTDPWVWFGAINTGGGTLGVTYSALSGATYTSLNGAGVAISIPGFEV